MKITAILVLIASIVCGRAAAQDTFFDAFQKGVAPHDGSTIKYSLDNADRTDHKQAARKIAAEAFLRMERKDFAQAERLLLEAHAADYPDGASQAQTVLALAELCERQGRYADAICYFEELYALTGEHDNYMVELGNPDLRYYAANEGTYLRSEAQTHMEYALTLVESDRWPEAVAQYEEALAQLVYKSLLYLEAVERLEKERQGVTAAVHTAAMLVKAMPREAVFQYLPAEWNVHFLPEQRQPDSLKARAHLFIGAQKRGFEKWPAAQPLLHLERALAYDPKNPYAYYEYGRALKEAERYEEAGKALRKAEALAGPNGESAKQAKAQLTEVEAILAARKPAKKRR